MDTQDGVLLDEEELDKEESEFDDKDAETADDEVQSSAQVISVPDDESTYFDNTWELELIGPNAFGRMLTEAFWTVVLLALFASVGFGTVFYLTDTDFEQTFRDYAEPYVEDYTPFSWPFHTKSDDIPVQTETQSSGVVAYDRFYAGVYTEPRAETFVCKNNMFLTAVELLFAGDENAFFLVSETEGTLLLIRMNPESASAETKYRVEDNAIVFMGDRAVANCVDHLEVYDAFSNSPTGPSGNAVEPQVHWNSFAICDEGSDRIEIRGQNLSGFDIQITGEIYAQNQGGATFLISKVPSHYSTAPYGSWAGPEERISNFYDSFNGVVWGYAEASYNGEAFSRFEMGETHLVCGTQPSDTYLPDYENYPLNTWFPSGAEFAEPAISNVGLTCGDNRWENLRAIFSDQGYVDFVNIGGVYEIRLYPDEENGPYQVFRNLNPGETASWNGTDTTVTNCTDGGLAIDGL